MTSPKVREVRHVPFPHEDDVERYLCEWQRWVGGNFSSLRSVAVDLTEDEIIERDAARDLMPQMPPTIFESAERTDRALHLLEGQDAVQRMALQHFHLVNRTAASVASTCRLRRGAVRETLRIAHDNFIVFRRS